MRLKNIIVIIFMTLSPNLAFSLELPLPPAGSDIVGEIKETHALGGETLGEIGRRFDVGFYEMHEANPTLDPENALEPGTKVILPTQFILPPGPRQGIVINLAELRLYYYMPHKGTVLTEPVGIGREGWQTPLGRTKIISKQKDPYWYPPQSVREDAERMGKTLPKFMPPGPDNPLGKHAMRLGWREYLIHGTNKPIGVGRRSSAGCIRMFPEDVEMLFSKVSIGTPVRIINEPYKVGWHQGQLYFEAHTPLQEDENYEGDMSLLVERIHANTQKRRSVVNWSEAQLELTDQSGLPIQIGHMF